MSRSKSIKDVIEHFDVSRSSIKNWLKEGVPHDKAPGKTGALSFDLDEVSVWIKRTGRNLRQGGDRQSPAYRAGAKGAGGRPRKELTTIEIEHAQAKLRKDLAAAEKAEMELDRLHGRLLDADEVKQGHLDRIARAKAVLLGAPASLSPDLVGLDQIDIEARLSDWICLALAELASEGAD